jgi:SNF family Na+-dependent transporter
LCPILQAFLGNETLTILQALVPQYRHNPGPGLMFSTLPSIVTTLALLGLIAASLGLWYSALSASRSRTS